MNLIVEAFRSQKNTQSDKEKKLKFFYNCVLNFLKLNPSLLDVGEKNKKKKAFDCLD